MAGSSWESAAHSQDNWRTRLFSSIERVTARPGVVAWLGLVVLWGLLLGETLPTLISQAAPSGADPGNWLDLAWSLTGQGARLTDWAYPPFFLALLRGLLAVFPPLTALKVIGLVSWGAMTAAVWFVLLRAIPRLPAVLKLGIAALTMLAGYNAEMFAWGGYPQMLGTTFLIISLPALEEYLLGGARRVGILAALTGFGVIFTHHLLAAALPLFWIIVFTWRVVQAPPGERRAVWGRFWKVALGAAAISLVALPVYVKYISLLAGNPANSSGFSPDSIPALLDYVYRGLAPLWLALLFPAMVTPFLIPRSRLSASTLALTWGTLAIFLVLWEVRYLQLLYVGIAFGLGTLFEQAWIYRSTVRIARLRQAVLVVLLGMVLLVSISQSQEQFIQSNAFYSVADGQVLPGIQWITTHVPRGERIIVSQAHLNHLDWWVAGLAQRPALAATNPRWLSFKDERTYAAIADQVFDVHTSPQQILQMLNENHIQWVFIDKKNEANNLSPLIEDGKMISGYEDPNVLILKVVGSR